MDTLRWIAATTAGFVLGGLALHSPGASGVGSSYLDADLSAAIFGAILGTIVGLTTGTLQLIALRSRNARLVAAAIIAVATAHALADGAPAVWGVPLVAALSGALAALPFAWATGVIDPRAVGTWTFVWAGGWLAGVTVAGALGLTGGGTPEEWRNEHAVIAGVLGIAWGSSTSPAMRRILSGVRALSSAG